MILYDKLLKYHLQGMRGLIVMVQKGGGENIYVVESRILTLSAKK